VTVTTMTLGSVAPEEVASAAGLQNFVRTIALAVATSLTMTYWDDQARSFGSDLAGKIHADVTSAALTARGFSTEQVRTIIAQLVDKEALTLATDKVFLMVALTMWLIAAWVWLSPRPKGNVPAEAALH